MTAELPHVLIAEDDSLARMSLEKTAKHFGCRVTAVRNGEEALSAYQDQAFGVVRSVHATLEWPRFGASHSSGRFDYPDCDDERGW